MFPRSKGFIGAFLGVIGGFCRIGDVLEADSVLRDWRNRRDFELDILIYGNFFYGLCKSGKFREARKLFDKLTTRDHDSGCAANFEPVLKPGRRVIFQLTYPGAISEMMAFEAYFRALCSFGRVDDAEKLLKIAIKKRTIPEICIFSCFIKALFKANRSDDALRFFEAHRNKADIAFAVVIGLCDIGKVDDAREFLNESINEGSVPTARVWNRVIKSYWETGHEEKAVGLFKELRARNCNGESYSVMICKFLEKGKVEVAVSLLDEMVAKKFEAGVDLYSGIVKGLYKIGRFDESNKWLNQIVENGVLVSYDEWESLYDSLSMEDGAKFWKLIEENYKNFLRENERRRSKGK